MTAKAIKVRAPSGLRWKISHNAPAAERVAASVAGLLSMIKVSRPIGAGITNHFHGRLAIRCFGFSSSELSTSRKDEPPFNRR